MEKPWLEHYEPGISHTIEYPKVPLHRFLEDSAKKYPHNTATIFFNGRLTYEELDALANCMANALINMGVGKGDRVALLLPNCPQFVAGYYGILKAGGVVVASSPLYVERELEHQLNDCGAETIITMSRFYPLVKRVQPKTKLKSIVVTNIKEYFPPRLKVLFTLFREKKEGHRVEVQKGDHLFQDLLQASSPEPPKLDVGPDDLAIFQYTGGTTGIPKAAVATHFSLVANTLQITAWFSNVLREGQEIVLAVLPFFHVYGMVAAMSFGIYSAAILILLPRFEIDNVLKTINRYKPTIFSGVPTMYVAVNNHPDIKRYDIKSIKACISGSAPLPVEVKERFEELTGGKLVEGYGLSEAPTANYANPILGKNKAGSIGLPFPDTEARIMDLETGGKEMPVGESGELVIRAPNLMKEYWNMPDETEIALREGWLYTGDIAKMDEDGYFYIVGRKKEMIIAGGYNIYPREVEEVLYQHPKVLEAAVVGVPDEYRGETVKAFIVPKGGEQLTEEEVVDFCKERLAKYKVPKLVEFKDELPKTIVGKVLKRELK